MKPGLSPSKNSLFFKYNSDISLKAFVNFPLLVRYLYFYLKIFKVLESMAFPHLEKFLKRI